MDATTQTVRDELRKVHVENMQAQRNTLKFKYALSDEELILMKRMAVATGHKTIASFISQAISEYTKFVVRSLDEERVKMEKEAAAQAATLSSDTIAETVGEALTGDEKST